MVVVFCVICLYIIILLQSVEFIAALTAA